MDKGQYYCAHPSIFSGIPEMGSPPFDPREHILKKEKEWTDKILIPICPCCGHGRTLFAHVQKTPELVIPAEFSDWCSDCRKQLASKLK